MYLNREGPRIISRAVRVTLGRVCGIIRHYQTYGTYALLRQRERSYPSKLSDVLKSIQLFKLMKPRIFEKEIHERLLNDGVCDGRSVPALSTVNKGIKNKLRMSYKKLL